MELVQPVRVLARDHWRIWIEYADGVCGEIDLSDMADDPACAEWRDESFWQSVHVTDHRAIAWSDDIELCPDSLYAELSGVSLDDIYGQTRVPRQRV